jgi:DNA invertase Pin-like site-specific DNA recombinase
MEDLAGIHKRLSFQGIEIQTVHDGTADSILIGIRGLVGQMQREDGAKKVRRGMAGVIRDGRHAGGRAYGYRAIAGKPGELEIEDEAAIVRRIFAAYAADERLGISHTISTEKTFVRRAASDGTHRRSMATPNVGLG